ncbi:MAG: hypothetical protein K9H41_00425 [Bacteroidia bacterium]|nr:hypothetical protein [Bacteroidia bacterium]
MKNNTLFISFYFPPFARVGGRRWAKHIKYFQRFGEKFKVLAGDFEGKSPWDDDVKSYESKITRLPITIYYPYYKRVLPKNVFQKIKWKISLKYNNFLEKKYPGNFWDDSRAYENKFYLKALDIIKREKISHICLSVGPFAYASILPKLKKEITELKITLDYRDYWHDCFDSLSKGKRLEEIQKQKSVLNVVDLVLAPNKEMCHYFEKEFNINTYLLPHCIDEDFLSITETKFVQFDKKRYVILYGGNLYDNMEPYILKLINLIKELKKSGTEVEFKLLTMQPSYVDLFRKNNINIEVNSLLPIPAFIELATKSDLILLMRPDWSPNAFSTKFFESVALRKPILYIGPNGEVNEFIKNNRLGFILAENSEKEMASILLNNALSHDIPDTRFSLDNNTFDLQTLELIKYWNKYYGFEN